MPRTARINPRRILAKPECFWDRRRPQLHEGVGADPSPAACPSPAGVAGGSVCRLKEQQTDPLGSGWGGLFFVLDLCALFAFCFSCLLGRAFFFCCSPLCVGVPALFAFGSIVSRWFVFRWCSFRFLCFAVLGFYFPSLSWG